MGTAKLGANLLLDESEALCLACNQAVAFQPDLHPLSFHCVAGHSLTLQDLLDDALLRGEKSPAFAFDLWPQKVMLLRRLAGQALVMGQGLAAADLQEAANRIDQWVSNLRVLLSRESVALSAGAARPESAPRAPEDSAGKEPQGSEGR
jgi:hypothetical protein